MRTLKALWLFIVGLVGCRPPAQRPVPQAEVPAPVVAVPIVPLDAAPAAEAPVAAPGNPLLAVVPPPIEEPGAGTPAPAPPPGFFPTLTPDGDLVVTRSADGSIITVGPRV